MTPTIHVVAADAGGDAIFVSPVAQTRHGRDGWPLERLIGLNAAAVAQELFGPDVTGVPGHASPLEGGS